jgi:hypothetical protein
MIRYVQRPTISWRMLHKMGLRGNVFYAARLSFMLLMVIFMTETRMREINQVEEEKVKEFTNEVA